MECPKCKTKNPDIAHFCGECGTPLNIPQKSWVSRHKWWFILGFLFFFFVILPTIFVLGIIGLAANSDSESKKEMIISGSGPDKIAVIDISGIILDRPQSQGFAAFNEDTTTAVKIRKTLNEISKDTDVKAVILNVNSPGGSAAASEEILQLINQYKQSSGKKVVAYFSDLSASGAYYVSMSADKIVANPSNITGSIGVIISYINYGDLASKYGVKNIVYKSGPHKDIISEFREPTDEEKLIMQGLIDDAYSNFVSAVSMGRKIPEGTVKALADGRVYSAQGAKQNNLVDSIGTFDQAISETKQLAGLKDATVVEFGQPSFLDYLLGSSFGKINMSILPGIDKVLFSKPGPSLLYLYTP